METTSQKRTSKLAILALVLAIFSVLLIIFPYVGVFFALVSAGVAFYAKRRIKGDFTGSLGGGGLAQGGLATSVVALVLASLWTFLILPALNRQVADVFKPITTELAPASQ